MPEHEPQQIAIMRRLVELSAERSFLNSERTLSVWVRTALGLMVLGLAVDRFRLIMAELPGGVGRTDAASNALSNWVGIALVAMGVVVAIATGLRFYFYAAEYGRQHQPPYYHGPILGPFFAAMVMVFGVALLVLLLVAAR